MIQRIHAIAIGLLLFSCASAPKKIETGPNADLLRAAAAGNSTLVEQAIMAGGDAQVRDERGRTPLMLAASAGNLETLKILLQPKATVAAKKSRREGVAIIHYLNNTGSKNNTWIGASLPDAIEGLMAENFDFKRSPADKTQKLANEAIGRATQYSAQLFKQIAEKTKAAVVISGSYALSGDGKHAVITTQVFDPAAAQIIIENETTATLDTNIFDALNQVAAQIVARLKEFATAEFAVRAKNSEQALISDVNARDRGDLTALVLAAEAKNAAAVDYLVKSGADYATDLIEAINFGNEQTALALAAAAPDSNFRIAGGKTALMQSAFKGRVSVVNVLLKHGAKKDLQDLYGFTALFYAAQEGHTTIVRDLLSAGVNPQVRTWDGFTALEAARRKGYAEIVEMLGKAGAK